jgi:hypothetical protein
MSHVSTAGRLLSDLHRESTTLCEVVASGAGILHDRAQRAMTGELRLTLAEQLRLAETTRMLAPKFAAAAARLRDQVLAASSFESGSLVVRHSDVPPERWEACANLRH